MCREIQAQGGDIFKYAGDAMIVLWPPSEDDSIENRIRCFLYLSSQFISLFILGSYIFPNLSKYFVDERPKLQSPSKPNNMQWIYTREFSYL